MAVVNADSLKAMPSLEQVRVLARDYNLIPLCETFIDDLQTPVSAFLKLREEGPAFLLESAEQGRVGRYSFIGFRPRSVLRWSLGDPGDPYALAADQVRRFRVAPVENPPPFAGGAVGMFAYDLVRTVESLEDPNPDTIGVPDLALMLTDALVIFDHLKHTVTVLANVYADEPLESSYRRAQDTIAEVRWRLEGPIPRPARPPASDRPVPSFRLEHGTRAVRGHGRPDHRVHIRRGCLPGRPLATVVGASPDRGVLHLPGPARGKPQPLHVFLGLR